jgi:hypothetical protein
MRYISFFLCLVTILLTNGFIVQEYPKQLTVKLPDFINDIYPAPGRTVSFDDYHRNFEAEYRFAGLRFTLPGIYLKEALIRTATFLPDQVTLIVDDQEVSGESMIYTDGLLLAQYFDDNGELLGETSGGPYTFYSEYPLEVGEHRALMRAESKEGEVFEYEWKFEIVP